MVMFSAMLRTSALTYDCITNFRKHRSRYLFQQAQMIQPNDIQWGKLSLCRCFYVRIFFTTLFSSLKAS